MRGFDAIRHERAFIGADRPRCLACILFALHSILRFAWNLPVIDEWDMSGLFSGDVGLTAWIFGSHNEHRYPLGRLLWYGLTVTFGYDFRVGMVANVLMLGLAARLLMNAARSLRGRDSVADACFPILLLHFGNHENYLMGYQVVCCTAILALAVVVATIARYRPESRFRSGLIVGGMLLVIMQSGGFGLVQVPFLGCWIAMLAWQEWQVGRNWRGIALLVAPLVAAGYTLFCFTSMAPTPEVTHHRSDQLTAILETFAVPLGGEVVHWAGIWLGWLALAGLIGLSVLMVRTWFREPAHRSLLAGLATLASATVVLGVGIAVSRGAGLASRYCTPMAFWVVVLLFVGVLAGSGRRRWIDGLSFTLAVVVFLANVVAVRDRLWVTREFQQSMLADVKKGMPDAFVIGKYTTWIYPYPERLLENLERYRKMGITCARDIARLADHTTTTIPVVGDARLGGGNVDQPIVISGSKGHLLGYVLEVEPLEEDAASFVELSWHGGRANAFISPVHFGRVTLAFWIDDVADEVRIRSLFATGELKVHRIQRLEALDGSVVASRPAR